jgi:cellulose biosynthesis protein BcsQ
MVAVIERVHGASAGLTDADGGSARREVVVAVAHQKGGVGKSTSTALLAVEMAWLRPELRILVEDLDPDRNLSARWPGDTEQVRLVEPGDGGGQLRLLDTGPGHPEQLTQLLSRTDHVVVPVRMEPMTTQALAVFLPRLRALQAVNGGRPHLAGLILTHYVGRLADHVQVREDLEAYAAHEGTRILGVVPFSGVVGMRLSTKGHYYRPAAQALLEVLDGHRRS